MKEFLKVMGKKNMNRKFSFRIKNQKDSEEEGNDR